MTPNSEESKTKARTKKRNWRNYQITQKFVNWAAPIRDTSYGNITHQDILDYILNNNLADEILPLVESGMQPMSQFGPTTRFQTKTHQWESNTEEYQRLKRILFGQPADEPKPHIPKKEKIIQTVGGRR